MRDRQTCMVVCTGLVSGIPWTWCIQGSRQQCGVSVRLSSAWRSRFPVVVCRLQSCAWSVCHRIRLCVCMVGGRPSSPIQFWERGWHRPWCEMESCHPMATSHNSMRHARVCGMLRGLSHCIHMRWEPSLITPVISIFGDIILCANPEVLLAFDTEQVIVSDDNVSIAIRIQALYPDRYIICPFCHCFTIHQNLLLSYAFYSVHNDTPNKVIWNTRCILPFGAVLQFPTCIRFHIPHMDLSWSIPPNSCTHDAARSNLPCSLSVHQSSILALSIVVFLPRFRYIRRRKNHICTRQNSILHLVSSPLSYVCVSLFIPLIKFIA